MFWFVCLLYSCISGRRRHFVIILSVFHWTRFKWLEKLWLGIFISLLPAQLSKQLLVGIKRGPFQHLSNLSIYKFLMDEFQLLLALLGGICCSIFLLKCIWFLKYFLPYIWNILPSSYFRSMGEWAGKDTFAILICQCGGKRY